MSPLLKKLVVIATLAGLGSAFAFALVACGADSSSPAARQRPAWIALPKAPVRIDAGLTGVWTGKKLIVSGIRMGPGGTFIGARDVAAAYDPAAGTWRRLARPPKTATYCHRDAAWTGREMLVWGCGQLAYDPASNTWRRLPQAPTGEGIAVWTGRELIGWGGGCCGDAWDSGSAYSPATGSWRTLARSPLAPNQRPLGAWTGRELLLVVSGIQAVDGKPAPMTLARAASYDPATDTWHRIAAPPLSGLHSGHAAVWDGRDLIVLGAGANARVVLAYRPATNRWRALARLPFPITSAEAFWTGRRVLVWGGAESARALSYDPQVNRWSVLPRPLLRGSGQTAVWTGSRLLVLSGAGGAALTPPPERSSR
jgi:hypothetical protein